MHRRATQPMRWAIQEFVTTYQWIHTSLGILGNLTFFIGSIFFLWESTRTMGTWLFIVGSAGMLIGSLGHLLVMIEEKKKR